MGTDKRHPLAAHEDGSSPWCGILQVCEHRRLLLQVLHGASDANIRFSDLALLLRDLGFQERVRGSHHIFTREGIEEILNLQPRGSMAKPYQVRQVRNVIVRYKLAEGLE